MQRNVFNSIKLSRPKRNVFDLTHDVKMSCKMGGLYPVMVTEVVPTDQLTIGAEALIRFAPMIAPVMHRFDVSIHYFFVPCRILWDNWEKFITGSDENVAFPTIADSVDTLSGYLGLNGSGLQVNAMPFAAYQCVYNEYYRDQNLINPVNYKLVDGTNDGNAALRQLRTRAWEHDYFTACLPTAQAGTSVDIPLGDIRLKDNWAAEPGNPTMRTTAGGVPSSGNVTNESGSGGRMTVGGSGVNDPVAYDPNGTLESSPTTITDLRRAFKLQEWLELSMRAGRRYVENIWAFFGHKSQDSRLQRPEYITGIKTPVVISEVLNTTGEDAGLPQGNMAGHGVSVASGKFGGYFVHEHGFVIGIMSVLPRTAYMSVTQKHWFKTEDRFQYYWPQFAHIGEQEVQMKELYPDAADPEALFGYNPRYAEYRYECSRVAGDFKSTLDYWHMARKFDNEPALNQQFVECDPGSRIFAVIDNSDKLYCHVLNRVKAIRPIPKFGNPMM